MTFRHNNLSSRQRPESERDDFTENIINLLQHSTYCHIVDMVELMCVYVESENEEEPAQRFGRLASESARKRERKKSLKLANKSFIKKT